MPLLRPESFSCRLPHLLRHTRATAILTSLRPESREHLGELFLKDTQSIGTATLERSPRAGDSGHHCCTSEVRAQCFHSLHLPFKYPTRANKSLGEIEKRAGDWMRKVSRKPAGFNPVPYPAFAGLVGAAHAQISPCSTAVRVFVQGRLRKSILSSVFRVSGLLPSVLYPSSKSPSSCLKTRMWGVN